MVDSPAVARVLLVRHGQSEWNLTGRWQGWAESPLTAIGEDQARQAAPLVADLGLTAAVSSGMQRTVRTVELLCADLGLEPYGVVSDLKEYDVGEWSGLTRPEIEQRWPGALDRWFDGTLPATPGGESRVHFLDRIVRAVRSVAAAHPGGVVLAVTHGGVIGTLQRAYHLDGNTPRIGNLSGRWVDVPDAADAAAADGDGGGDLRLGPLVHLLDPGHETVPAST